MIERQKYFYTILFLDNYKLKRDDSTTQHEDVQIEAPILKSYEIKNDLNNETIKWLEKTKLYVRHNLPMPLTVEMWDSTGKTIFYSPILKEGADIMSIGHIEIESSRSIVFYFDNGVFPPKENEIYKLSIKTLPSFDTTSERHAKDIRKVKKSLDEMIGANQTGLAIVFRRHSLDAHFDLEVDFDESYLHSLAEDSDLKYLTKLSKFNTVKWLTKYTDNLQDVLDEINTRHYEVEYSWKENGSQWWENDDPFGYQEGKGHLPYKDR